MTDNLRDAAQAVLDRWDSRDWKAAPTADYMNRLRAALAAAPQPAPDREALVEVIRDAVSRRDDNWTDTRTEHEAIADALLASGLRLPGDAEAERDAAFAAGQEEMRARAAKAAEMAFHTGAGANDLLAAHNGGIIMAQNHIRALPIKDRPE